MKKIWLIFAIIIAIIIALFFGGIFIVLIRFALMLIFSPIVWVILIVLFFVSRALRR